MLVDFVRNHLPDLIAQQHTPTSLLAETYLDKIRIRAGFVIANKVSILI